MPCCPNAHCRRHCSLSLCQQHCSTRCKFCAAGPTHNARVGEQQHAAGKCTAERRVSVSLGSKCSHIGVCHWGCTVCTGPVGTVVRASSTKLIQNRMHIQDSCLVIAYIQIRDQYKRLPHCNHHMPVQYMHAHIANLAGRPRCSTHSAGHKVFVLQTSCQAVYTDDPANQR